MTRLLKTGLALLLALAFVLAAGIAAGAWWLSGDGPRSQLEARLSQRLGVAVSVGQLSLQVWPLPNVVVSELKLATTPPLTAQQISLRPVWARLLSQPRELEIAALSLRGLMLPQQGLDELSTLLSKNERSAQKIQGQKPEKASKTEDAAALEVGLLAIAQQLSLDKVTWLSQAGEALTVSGDVRLNAARDQAQVDLALGGGSLRGRLDLARSSTPSKASAASPWQLRGELKTQGVDLLTLPGLGTRMAGRLDATTTLEAQALQLDGLGAALQTRTDFNVNGAVIKGVDVARAVRTLGLSRGGETVLQQLSGQVSTRGAGAPMQLALTQLQAQSSLLRASGAVNVGAAAKAGAPRALSGRLDVDLTAGDSKVGQVVDKTVGQLVGIPLEIGGTTAAPEVRPTRGAMIGGAVGSVMAPVIGTGAGAKLGDKVGQTLGGLKERLFGK